MPKTEKIEIGSYSLSFDPKATREAYEKISPYQGEDPALSFFHYLIPRADEKSLAFLKKLGIDPLKIPYARPMTEPDENGEILYLAHARFCGEVLAGGDTEPRQSEEIEKMSAVFVREETSFNPALDPLPSPQSEIRFVIPLPFDPSFFEEK